MSVPGKPNRSGLVPAANRALITTSSALAKRGLDLLREQELSRRTIRVLIGDRVNIHESISLVIKNEFKGKYEVLVTVADTDDLLKYARSQTFDMFILVLNNLSFPCHYTGSGKRIDTALELVTHLKATYQKPVIAMAGWPDDPLLGEKAKRAGANSFFRLPFDVPNFRKALRMCIRLPDEPERIQ